MQNAAIRTILKVTRDQLLNYELYSSTGILSLDKIVKVQLCTVIFNHSSNSKILQTLHVHDNQVHNYHTRTSNDLPFPSVKNTTYGLNGVLYRSVSTFNSLPCHRGECNSQALFKKLVELFFINCPCNRLFLYIYLNGLFYT